MQHLALARDTEHASGSGVFRRDEHSVLRGPEGKGKGKGVGRERGRGRG